MHSPTRSLLLVIGLGLGGSLLLTGCGDDPLGADNRMALLALGKCRHDQALQMTDNAIARGTEHNAQKALLLQAAILRDQGDIAAAEVLYPRIAAAWESVKGRPLTEERRERDIRLFLDVARNERLANGLPPDCRTGDSSSGDSNAAAPTPGASPSNPASRP
ncbi:hypothetical protein F2Q65_13345 [Thiohalocapsa marina]|uniref:Tetratricopeptide repeat protein n=1 Tax=Thiohalocapsa marina TaxID=424902 RepID=A0A5M8FM19_9GAMM|nr:hypothetical protein [Thiohalocapsa marina]KAA6184171.1 hypothetical protein F2Q65_13345 [Thiohalocapsa marina]